MNPSQYTDYSLAIDYLLADGDKVVYSVTHRYISVEIGKKIRLTTTCILRMANGKIMENWVLDPYLESEEVGKKKG